jgi:hypothetical protein
MRMQPIGGQGASWHQPAATLNQFLPFFAKCPVVVQAIRIAQAQSAQRPLRVQPVQSSAAIVVVTRIRVRISNHAWLSVFKHACGHAKSTGDTPTRVV